MCAVSAALLAAICTTGDAFTRSNPRKATTALAAKPKAVIFDLDGCLWYPEMYMMSWRGGGAPFVPKGDAMVSQAGEAVTLLGDVRAVVAELRADWPDAVVGISSRTDEPAWARELLEKFRVEDFALGDAFDARAVQISKDSKVAHFERIAAATSIPFEDMLFFDNELGNLRAVTMLGVTCAYCPEGVDDAIWREALAAFPAPAGDVVGVDAYGLGR